MTYDDFIGWKNHPVTQLMHAMCADLIEQKQAILGQSAGVDPLQDRLHVGYIAGLREVLHARAEEVAELEDAE